MKGDKMVKRSSIGSIMRKRLSDITNSLPQIKPNVIKLDNSVPVGSGAQESVDSLIKENMAMVKLIEDKNKLIELNGFELQNVRITLQKLQLQNWNLAQVNSHMIAELNLGKEKLKCIQQELMCKEALLKAMPKILQEKGTLNCDNVKDDVVMKESGPNNGTRKQRPIRSRSVGNLSPSQQLIEQTAAENKRRCLRRKSATFRVQQQEPPSEDLFEIEDVKCTSAIANEVRDGKQRSGSNSQRASLGRPLRKAAQKVQTYKETPVNMKMRRTE